MYRNKSIGVAMDEEERALRVRAHDINGTDLIAVEAKGDLGHEEDARS